MKSLHVFIYDAESPNTPTVAEFTVAGGTLTQKPAGSSTWMTSQPISTKKTDKYIFAGVNLNAEIVNYITSNGLGAFSYKDFTQEITKLADQTNGFVMFNSAYPTLTPAAVNGGGTMTDLKFGWRNLNKKFYFIQDNRDALIKDYNWANYTAEDFTRGTDAINVYASADVPTSFSYATENAFQYISGTSNVDAATFISVSGVFTPTNIISAKKNPPTVAADFEMDLRQKSLRSYVPRILRKCHLSMGSTYYRRIRIATDCVTIIFLLTVTQSHRRLLIISTETNISRSTSILYKHREILRTTLTEGNQSSLIHGLGSTSRLSLGR